MPLHNSQVITARHWASFLASKEIEVGAEENDVWNLKRCKVADKMFAFPELLGAIDDGTSEMLVVEPPVIDVIDRLVVTLLRGSI